MHITDLNECLLELPEIGVFEFFRTNRPIQGPFRWTGADAVDAHSENLVGPILVDDCGIEYVVHATLEAITPDVKVSRVSRPNGTTRFQDMTRSSDVPPDLRRAMIAFARNPAQKKAA